MALLGNYSSLSNTPGRFRAGTTLGADRANFGKSGSLKNRFVSEGGTGIKSHTAIPNGYLHPYTWAMPRTGGGMASYKQLSAAISETTQNLVGGINAVAALSGNISTTDAQLDQIVALIAALSASISTTNAELAATLEMIANGITASGTLTDADVSALAYLVSALSGSGSFTLVDNFSTAAMSADISSVTELSPDSLATAVLDNSEVEDTLSVREALRLISAAVAGKLSGAAGTTVTIRNAVADDKDRIVATVDSNGNRTAITYDVT